MVEENASLDFTLEKSRWNKIRICTTLNYVEHLLFWTIILTSAVTGSVSVSTFTSLVGISKVKIHAITAGIKKYKSQSSRKRRKSMIKWCC